MADTNTPTTIEDANKEIGASGTYIFSGFITGEEYATDLIGKQALKQYDIMRRSDPTVRAALTAVKNPIIGANWDVEPASDDATDIEVADFVKRELFDRAISWQDTVRESLTCLDFGHYVAEIVNDVTEFNGKPYIGLAKVASRKQRSIMSWETVDKQEGIQQLIPAGNLVSIPRNKLMYVVNEKEGDNYEGISLLRFAYKPWKIKDNLELMNAVALERMAIGVPVVKKGINNEAISEPELDNLRSALREMRANEEAYIEIPASVDLQMLDMKGQSVKDVLPTIAHNNTEITLSVLAQFLMLGSGGSSGSRAVSSDHSALFLKSLEAVARTFQQAFQKDVIDRLVDLNYGNLQNGYPKLVFSEIGDDNIEKLAAGISALVTSTALTPDAGMEQRLRQILKLPDLPEDMVENYQELKKPAPTASPFGVPSDTPPADNKDANTPDKKDENIDDANTKDKTEASVIADARKARKILVKYLDED